MGGETQKLEEHNELTGHKIVQIQKGPNGTTTFLTAEGRVFAVGLQENLGIDKVRHVYGRGWVTGLDDKFVISIANAKSNQGGIAVCIPRIGLKKENLNW